MIDNIAYMVGKTINFELLSQNMVGFDNIKYLENNLDFPSSKKS